MLVRRPTNSQINRALIAALGNKDAMYMYQCKEAIPKHDSLFQVRMHLLPRQLLKLLIGCEYEHLNDYMVKERRLNRRKRQKVLLNRLKMRKKSIRCNRLRKK
jgi:hypothetical protein